MATTIVCTESYLLAGEEHWGILMTKQEPIDILRRRLLAVLFYFTADELKNQLLWINNFEELLS